MFISVRVLSEGDIGSIIFVYIFKNYSLYVNGSVLFIRQAFDMMVFFGVFFILVIKNGIDIVLQLCYRIFREGFFNFLFNDGFEVGNDLLKVGFGEFCIEFEIVGFFDFFQVFI